MKICTVLLFAAICCVSCADNDDGAGAGGSSFKEPKPETIVFENAVLSYYGDDSYSGVADLWTLKLTEKSAGDAAGRMMAVSVNAQVESSGVPDLACLAGSYHMPANSGDMSAGTFNPGYMYQQDRPNGAVSVPAGSFFGDMVEDMAQFDADLLREGQCSVEVNDDGSVTIQGILIGTEYLKRYFSYRGVPQVVDATDGTVSEVPNSNLTGDVELVSLAATRITDKGDSYFLGDESYRHFEFYLADAGIDLSTQWPGGDGELLRLELFVPWETDPEEGVPAGTYIVPDDVPVGGGIYRDDIVPFRIVPGYPDKFTSNTGTWYQSMEAGRWVNYARITGGTVTVERPDGRYRITVDLVDCGAPARHVKAVWED